MNIQQQYFYGMKSQILTYKISVFSSMCFVYFLLNGKLQVSKESTGSLIFPEEDYNLWVTLVFSSFSSIFAKAHMQYDQLIMALLPPGPGHIFFNHKLKKKTTPLFWKILRRIATIYLNFVTHCLVQPHMPVVPNSGLISHLLSRTGTIMQPQDVWLAVQK